ncbi:TerD family protein [Actinomadura kijaniata]|uniref:TerD family protein n=1 Tax=Actinomadura kijaniata TaxID=46161 RepID=UPI003F1DE31F
MFDLPEAPWWTIAVSWDQQARGAADVVAFALDEDGRVAADGDFVFYGAPESTDGTVRLSTDGPAEQSVALDLAALPPAVRRVAVAAAIDGPGTFGDLGAIEVAAVPSTRSVPLARATLDTATTERTLLLAEVYRRGEGWRLRPVGQGHGYDLPELARSYGVDVED